jgi:hypothetical protein
MCSGGHGRGNSRRDGCINDLSHVEIRHDDLAMVIHQEIIQLEISMQQPSLKPVVSLM